MQFNLLSVAFCFFGMWFIHSLDKFPGYRSSQINSSKIKVSMIVCLSLTLLYLFMDIVITSNIWKVPGWIRPLVPTLVFIAYGIFLILISNFFKQFWSKLAYTLTCVSIGLFILMVILDLIGINVNVWFFMLILCLYALWYIAFVIFIVLIALDMHKLLSIDFKSAGSKQENELKVFSLEGIEMIVGKNSSKILWKRG